MKNKIIIIALAFFFCINLYPMSLSDKPIVEARIKDFDKRIPKDHPRALLLKSELKSFKEFFDKTSLLPEYSYIFKDAILNKFNIPFLSEPKKLPKERDAERTKLWREGYENAFNSASYAQHYAFSYMITGEEKYARESAGWLMYLTTWDLNGGVEIKNNDEAFIQSLRPMLLAYDWVRDALTTKEKKEIESNLKERMDILFEWVTSLYMVSEPLPIDKNNSHKMRFISTIGLGGLALYHELKDAPLWLSWAYEYYNRLFPSWGGSDGGYSEGLDYWRTGHNQHLMFLDAMKALGLNEVFNRSYFKNNGYFALYNVMPFPFSSFSDLCNTQTPNENTAMHIEKYALIYNDPYLMRFHDIIFQKYPYKTEYYNYSFYDSIFQLYRKGNTSVGTKELSELPRSRYFSDIGWVAMHSKLGNKTDDMMLGFKSSPYGSASHSFADQNSFVINAFGEQLAISSGYREWYGSSHHYGWTKMTISKNAVLFDNKGQKINDAAAKGKIIRFYTGKNFDFTTGDAKSAFDASLGVVKNLRSALFVNNKYFIVYDELENKRSISHQWLFHSKESITVNHSLSSAQTVKGNASLYLRFIFPKKEELKFSVSDEFKVPVDPAYSKRYKNEYHFKADAYKPALSREFITLLHPFKNDKKESLNTEILNAKTGNIISVSGNDFQDYIFLSKETDKECSGDLGALKGKAGILSVNKSSVGFALIEGTEFKTDKIFVQSDKTLSMEGEISDEKIAFNIRGSDLFLIKIKSVFNPVKFEGITKENFNYDPANKMLTIKLSGDSDVVLLK